MRTVLLLLICGHVACSASAATPIGLGAKAPREATVLLDGTRATLDAKWEYWEGPAFSSEMPIKWPLVKDPKGEGMALKTFDPKARSYGSADIVTKEKYRDFRLHIEFLALNKGANSGVYLQNRYEIQIHDGHQGKHGTAAVINEAAADPGDAYKGTMAWNAYDILFRAARFKDGKRVQNALVTVYLNGIKVHENQEIKRVWGGGKSGIDGDNDGGRGITDRPGGVKLQCETRNVLFRNAWIVPLELKEANTDF